jgi:hypothetical protein
MDHIDAMVKGNLDDFVLGEVSSNGSKTLANLISLIRL